MRVCQFNGRKLFCVGVAHAEVLRQAPKRNMKYLYEHFHLLSVTNVRKTRRNPNGDGRMIHAQKVKDAGFGQNVELTCAGFFCACRIAIIIIIGRWPRPSSTHSTRFHHPFRRERQSGRTFHRPTHSKLSS